MHMSTRQKLCALALSVVTAAGLGACGSSDNSSDKSSSSGSGGSTSTPAATKPASGFDAQAEGTKAAEAAGGQVTLPQKTIGFLNIIRAIESADRAEKAFTEAGKALGWKVISCDGQGDPTKIASCADTLLNQGAQAIATNGVEAAQVTSALKRAKAKGIPFVECTSNVSPSKLFWGEYGPDETASGKIAADYLIKQLGSDGGQVAVHSFPTGFASLRTQALLDALKAHPNIKVVDTVDTDLADPAGSTAKAVSAQLTRFPDLKAVWVAFDIAIPGAAQAIQQKLGRKSFPDRPLVVGFNANTASLQWMDRGIIDALSDTAFENTCWAAVDQFAEYYARDKKPEQGAKGETIQLDYGAELTPPQLVTKDNIPGKPDSDSVDPMPQPVDWPAFFRAKWSAEFGKS
jgi:ABC-type sugar transport system substrate-binding protein